MKKFLLVAVLGCAGSASSALAQCNSFSTLNSIADHCTGNIVVDQTLDDDQEFILYVDPSESVYAFFVGEAGEDTCTGFTPDSNGTGVITAGGYSVTFDCDKDGGLVIRVEGPTITTTAFLVSSGCSPESLAPCHCTGTGFTLDTTHGGCNLGECEYTYQVVCRRDTGTTPPTDKGYCEN